MKYLLTLFLAVGCSWGRTSANFKYIEPGMERAQVIRELGDPEREITSQDVSKKMHYRLCDRGDLAWCSDKYSNDYWVILQDGRVIKSYRDANPDQVIELRNR